MNNAYIAGIIAVCISVNAFMVIFSMNKCRKESRFLAAGLNFMIWVFNVTNLTYQLGVIGFILAMFMTLAGVFIYYRVHGE